MHEKKGQAPFHKVNAPEHPNTFAPSPQARLERLWVGTFMTSLDMHGLSLSLMKLDDELMALLDAPAEVGDFVGGLARLGFATCIAITGICSAS